MTSHFPNDPSRPPHLRPPPLPPRAVLPLTFPPPLPPPRRRRLVPVLLVVAVVVLAAGGGTAWLVRQRLAARNTGWPVETMDQKFGAVREAFAPATAAAPATADPGVSPADVAAVNLMLTQLGRALDQRQGAAAASLFDFHRMAEETLAQPGVPSYGIGGARNVAAGFRTSFTQDFVSGTGLRGWNRHQVHRVDRSAGDDDEVLVYARHWDADGESFRFRWWLRRSGRGWRVYDYEELTEAYRTSVCMGEGMSAAAAANGAWSTSYQHVLDAIAANGKGDQAAAEASLRKADGAWLPPQCEATRWVTWCYARYGQGRYDEALAAIAKADAAAPNMPLVHTMRSLSHLAKGEYEQALAATRRFEDALGPVADNLHTAGLALAGLGRGVEAADAHRRGLDEDPDSADNLVALAAVLPDDGKAEVADRFARSSMSREHFDRVADQVEDAGDDVSLRLLVDAYVAKQGKDATSATYAARLKMRRGEFEAAVAEVNAALEDTTVEADRVALRQVYLYAMRGAGRAAEAYRQSPDRAGAFLELARAMAYDDDAGAGLRELVEARRADAPDEFWTHFYDGVAREQALDYPAAEAAYARAAAVGGDEEQRRMLRRNRVDVRYAQGQALSALAELEPRDETFGQLASLYAGDEDADGLEKLIAAYGVSARGDPQVRMWDAEVKWLRKEYKAAADGFLQHFALVGAERSYDDRIIRSLIRAGRAAEALPHALRYQKDEGESYYVLLVNAAAGHVAAATQTLAKCLEEGYELEDLYADEDLGPFLLSEAFAPLRAAHPRPAPPTTSNAPSTLPVDGEVGTAGPE
jgi:hypothetical protein